MVETLAELPFIGDQVGLLKPRRLRDNRRMTDAALAIAEARTCGNRRRSSEGPELLPDGAR